MVKGRVKKNIWGDHGKSTFGVVMAMHESAVYVALAFLNFQLFMFWDGPVAVQNKV